MRTLALALAIPVALCAADPVELWPDYELDAAREELTKNLDENQLGVRVLGEFPSHRVLLIHREGNGPAEIHDEWTDFYVVKQGTATLQIGGKIQNPTTLEPGELRGASLVGAKTLKLQAGDTVNIPPKTPHQILLPDGSRFTYLIVKVKAR